jgi:hypothetical protein
VLLGVLSPERDIDIEGELKLMILKLKLPKRVQASIST